VKNKVEVQFHFVGGRCCLIKWKWSSTLFGRARSFGLKSGFLRARGCGMRGIFGGNFGENDGFCVRSWRRAPLLWGLELGIWSLKDEV
jgi:hypothetical protein